MNLTDVYTTIPGIVEAYDGRVVTARPAIDKMLANGQVLSPPKIVDVPVYWMTGDGGSALISVPLKPGDNVVLHFSMRSLDNWLSGANQAPDDPRQFDMTDAFCTPVLRPTVRAADTENVSVEYGPGTLKIAPTGDMTIDVPNLTANVKEDTVINTKTATINASEKTHLTTGQLTVDADSTTINSPTTINDDLTVNGSGTFSGDVTAGGISLKHHKHPGDSGGTTGEPI